MNTIFSENDHSCFANLGAQYISPSVQKYNSHNWSVSSVTMPVLQFITLLVVL